MKTRLLILSAAAAVLVTDVTPAAAQANSVLALLPTDGRRIEIGRQVTGALSGSDVLSARDNYLEAWEFAGRAGQQLYIDLMSDDFDPILYMIGPGLAETLSDDDSGEGCNARLSVTLLDTGTFRLVASSLGSRDTGQYTLRVAESPMESLDYNCGGVNPMLFVSLPAVGVIEYNSTVSGMLTLSDPSIRDGRRGQAWTFQAEAGQTVSFSLSADFDTYLYVAGPGIDEPMTDDDGGDGTNSLLTVTFPRTGEYKVVASSFSDGQTGSYTLRAGEPEGAAGSASHAALIETPTYGRTIDAGQLISGTLSEADPVLVEDRRGQAWAFRGRAGQRVEIELRSDDFDCYLYFIGPGLALQSDDDSGGDLDSRLVVTLPETGEYRVIVSALSSFSYGDFTLEVSDRR